MDARIICAAVMVVIMQGGAAGAATPQPASTPAAPAQAAPTPAVPDAINIYFAPNSTTMRPEDLAQLDFAARLYREATPLVMQVAGSADSVGSPVANLRLSQQRADVVFRGLVDRGIPASRFQILAKGVTDPPVHTADNTPEERNRCVRITWR